MCLEQVSHPLLGPPCSNVLVYKSLILFQALLLFPKSPQGDQPSKRLAKQAIHLHTGHYESPSSTCCPTAGQCAPHSIGTSPGSASLCNQAAGVYWCTGQCQGYLCGLGSMTGWWLSLSVVHRYITSLSLRPHSYNAGCLLDCVTGTPGASSLCSLPRSTSAGRDAWVCMKAACALKPWKNSGANQYICRHTQRLSVHEGSMCIGAMGSRVIAFESLAGRPIMCLQASTPDSSWRFGKDMHRPAAFFFHLFTDVSEHCW